MEKKQKDELLMLPLWIIKVNSKWFKNTRSGAFINKKNITDHLPKEKITPIVKEYWWNNY